MRTIELKKTELAKMKGLGISTEGIATKLGITKKEATEAMIHFGLTKGRASGKIKEYTIVYTDDVTAEVDASVTA